MTRGLLSSPLASSFVLSIPSLLFVCLLTPSGSAADVPRVSLSGMKMELVAAEPQIVTPVGCRFDSQGRLFVIESHTHFPPEGYEGPKHDLIKMFDDSDGDGTLDRNRVFHAGTVKTMSLAILPDDSVLLATRSSIIHIRDSDGDDVADQTKVLITLETKADYPHNGLSGLWIDPVQETVPNASSLVFGMGENFGAPYRLIGSDGRVQAGQGEGGNIFRCTIEGKQLERVATGFWNPFGICRDSQGRLLMVDNDADAMPPCRIVEVLPQADYGFQFRFGRAGTHPLQAWNGELPGTLPMLAGTGEAPCAILDIKGRYWVTSWGDNRIERYTPVQQGVSASATREIVVSGDAMFRPVDMAVAPDGSLYITDWVDRSYNVHRKGRIWRLSFDSSSQATKEHRTTSRVAKPDASWTIDQLRASIVQSEDPFLAHLAATEASHRDWFDEDLFTSEEPDRVRLAWFLNQHWRAISRDVADETPEQTRLSLGALHALISRGLEDRNVDVQLAAVRWAAELGDSQHLAKIQALLDHDPPTDQALAGIASAISYLQLGKIEAGGFDALTHQTLIQLAIDPARPVKLRRMAMSLVPPESPVWKPEMLVAAVTTEDSSLARTAARHLSVTAMTNEAARAMIDTLVADKKAKPGLAEDLQIARSDQSAASPPSVDGKPSADDLEGWLKVVGEGGDPERGWRVFFSASRGKCASCHKRDGRGAGVGPDLTSLTGQTTDRRRLLESILHPSREIGPMYTPWQVLTTDGRVIVGLKLNGGGVGQSSRYLLADSTTVDVPLEQIEEQAASPVSIMPSGLEKLMSVDDMRDLLAFLVSPHESSIEFE